MRYTPTDEACCDDLNHQLQCKMNKTDTIDNNICGNRFSEIIIIDITIEFLSEQNYM